MYWIVVRTEIIFLLLNMQHLIELSFPLKVVLNNTNFAGDF